MPKTLYLINPACDFPTYYGGEVFGARGFQRATLIADLSLPTVAALAPESFEVRLCDENFEEVDFGIGADFIGITGKVSQFGRMRAIAREFRERGKTVIIGGPYASLAPETVRPHCDILVRGEIEDIAAGFFADLEAGRWKDEYVGDKVELAGSPVPRWDLYPNDRAYLATVQTSRGCPFECEFCDVIQYLGRKQRHKEPPQVLRELDEVYRHGYRSIFLSDDNFTVYRQRAKELLEALIRWNEGRQDGHVQFFTQASMDAAKDPELLEMCSRAGLTNVFIGIETPNEASLKETHKRQNLGGNLADQVQTFVDHGISVQGGMIVGFDSDGPDIFDRQIRFADSVPIGIFTLGALVAPVATPLHARMAAAGRLAEGLEVAATPWSTNIVPRLMSREQMLGGIQTLANRLYHPARFAERVVRFTEKLGRRHDPLSRRPPRPQSMRPMDFASLGLISQLSKMGDDERAMLSRIQKAAAARPEATMSVYMMLVTYMQIRHMYDQGRIWEPHLAGV